MLTMHGLPVIHLAHMTSNRAENLEAQTYGSAKAMETHALPLEVSITFCSGARLKKQASGYFFYTFIYFEVRKCHQRVSLVQVDRFGGGLRCVGILQPL